MSTKSGIWNKESESIVHKLQFSQSQTINYQLFMVVSLIQTTNDHNHTAIYHET